MNKELFSDYEEFDTEENPLQTIINDKPKYYNISDINNYNEKFLKKIIEWQERLIKYYKEKGKKK